MDCIYPVSYTHLDVYKRQTGELGKRSYKNIEGKKQVKQVCLFFCLKKCDGGFHWEDLWTVIYG